VATVPRPHPTVVWVRATFSVATATKVAAMAGATMPRCA